MIDRTAKLSVSRQAIVLGISRGSVYYKPRPVSDADLKLMHRIDKLHMEFPFAGSRMLQGLLVQEGFKVGRLHVATLMKRMGIEALYRKPNTSKPAPGHKIYPYLLRKLPITRPNQVWAMDITYIPMARGLHLPRRRAGLVHPARPGMAGVDHAGGRLLHRSCGGGAGATRHARDLQHAIRAASSPRPTSSRCWPPARSRSAWMARAPGATTSSSSACGGPSNTRRSTCGPTPASPKPAPGSAAISASTTAAAHIHRLTGKRPIRPTSTSRCPKRRRHNRGGKPLRKRPEPVQTNRTTSGWRSYC